MFTVRGANYIAGMSTDMAFLATGFPLLRDRFGMDLGTGNPFTLPCVYLSTTTNGDAGVAGTTNVPPSEGKSKLGPSSKKTVRKNPKAWAYIFECTRGRGDKEFRYCAPKLLGTLITQKGGGGDLNDAATNAYTLGFAYSPYHYDSIRAMLG